MSKIALNLKEFQHVKSNKNSTTLKHKGGHELTIKHAALSPEFQEQLKALIPKTEKHLEEKPKKMAEGGPATVFVGQSDGTPPAREKTTKEKLKETGEGAQKGGVSSDSPLKTGDWSHIWKAAGGFIKMAEGGYLPCINPNCKSHGSPHPNCRCYPNGNQMAEGGEVSNKYYCLTGKPHKAECAYYKDGSPEGVSENDLEPIDESADPQAVRELQGEPQNVAMISKEDQGIDKEIADAEAVERAHINPELPPDNLGADDKSQMSPEAVTEPPTPQAAAPTAPPNIEASNDPIQRFEAHKAQAKDSMVKHDMDWEDDLRNGHVTPETYSSLFAKKTTPGKIGTLFGLLVSGLGSGLAHQSNAVVDMMKQELQNDFEAQKQSKTNAENFLRLSQAHTLNEAHANSLDAETAVKANTLAMMMQNRAALHDITSKVNAMPPGPMKQQALVQLAMLHQAVQSDNYNLADRAATASAYYNQLGVGKTPSSDTEQDFQQQQRTRQFLGPEAQKLAEYDSQRHIPGIPGMASRPIPEEKRSTIQAMKILDDKGRDVLDFVQKHRGTWNPKTRAIAEQKIEEMKNFYNDSIGGGVLTHGRLDWYKEQFAKSPTDILSQLMGSTARLQEMVGSNARRLDLELQGLGYHIEGLKSGSAAHSKEPQLTEMKDKKSGKIVLVDPKTKKPVRWK